MWALFVVALVGSCVGAPEDKQIESWNPTVDDVKPFKYHVFGDSTKIALQPVFNKQTYHFINDVLNAQPELTVPAEQNRAHNKTEEHAAHASPFQDLVPMVKLNRSFFEHDYDRSGRLELREAKNIFDKFHVFFQSIEELNSFFDDGYINYIDYCEMLKTKNVISDDERLQFELAYLNNIFLNPKDLPDRHTLRFKIKAIYWALRYLENYPNEPLPTPPQYLIPTEFETLAEETIVRVITAMTGRSKVTYATAHLSKDQAEEIEKTRRGQTYLCHPGEQEECSNQQPCCRELKCCLIGETRKGYCASECQAATNATQPTEHEVKDKYTSVSTEQHKMAAEGIPFPNKPTRDNEYVLGQPKNEIRL